MQLSCKTRTNTPVRGIPKVYFCCHPQDFDAHFDTISNEILAKQNCSVWYHGQKQVTYTEAFWEDLLQMQMFVIPVTSRFLQEGEPVLEREFRFAMENHIPVLPLMQERGLNERFNRLCGQLQYLDKYNTDSTCIEYTEKLDKFLSSVLVGDALTEKIRNAFDAYIFLSYRKKDRKQAQALMKLIHQNAFCRDIAIWYDEYLVPGENFNEAIREALEKSDLFVLAVTPNLVNEDNYIMRVEYPMAKAQQKPILPCEMVDTNKQLLVQRYDKIPTCTNGNDSRALAENLRQHFLHIATKPANSTPEHLFFIGLAYLNGIDVEVDRPRALKMITQAAEQELTEAVETLIAMYANGDGVELDRYKAMQWCERLYAITGKNYRREKTYETAFAWVRACYELATAADQMELYERSIFAAKDLKAICTSVMTELSCNEWERRNLRRHVAIGDILLGQGYHGINDFVLAKEHYEKAEKTFAVLNKEAEDPAFLSDTGVLYSKIAQLYKVNAHFDDALHYYREALRIQQYNAKTYGGESLLTEQVMTRILISEIQRLIGDYKGAEISCREAIEITQQLERIHGEAYCLTYKMLTHLALAEAYRLMGDCDGALTVFRQLADLEALFDKRYGLMNAFIRATRLKQTTHIYFQMGDLEATIQYGTQTLTALKEAGMDQISHIATGGTECLAINAFLGLAYYNGRNDLKSAKKYLAVACTRADECIKRGVLSSAPDAALAYVGYADVLQIEEELELANQNLEKAQEVYETYLSSENDFRHVATAATIYAALGKNRVAQEQPVEAMELFQKAMVQYDRLLLMNPHVESTLQRDIVQVYGLMGACAVDVGDRRAKEWYEKAVAIYDEIPEERLCLQEWSSFGIALYQIYSLNRNPFKSGKWKNRVFDAAEKICYYFPQQYQQTPFYMLLSETGIFD